MTNELLMKQWLDAKKKLAQAKDQELRLRNQILEKAEGTTIFGGYKIRVNLAYNYTVDKSEFYIHNGELTPEELAAINWQPKVNVKQFKQLPADSLVHKIVTVKPGQGSITLV